MPENDTAPQEDDSPGRIWQGIKSLLSRKHSDRSLRSQLEDAIDGHEDQTVDTENGDLNSQERKLLRNLLHFSETRAGDVGVPRADIIAVGDTASFDDIVALFSEHGHSRLPVYKDNLDDVVGMILFKDIFATLAKKGARRPKGIKKYIRQPLFVPESMDLLELLNEMQRTQLHLAIVLDEYSGTERLITIEDLVEEIVGEIHDEHDDAPTQIATPVGDDDSAAQMWEVDARADLDQVGEAVGDLRLTEVEEDIDTIGGLAVVLAGHVPQPGEILTAESGWQLEILEGDEKRVSKIRLHAPFPAEHIRGEA